MLEEARDKFVFFLLVFIKLLQKGGKEGNKLVRRRGVSFVWLEVQES